jgi:hypothetical protein
MLSEVFDGSDLCHITSPANNRKGDTLQHKNITF